MSTADPVRARGLHPPDKVADYLARGWWSEETVDQVFADTVRARPDDLALVDPANKADLTGGAPRRLTWAELAGEVDGLAARLLDLGLEQGDVLAVQLPNTVELVEVYLAAWALGIVVSPLPVQYREHEIQTLARQARFRAFLTTPTMPERQPAAEVAGIRDQLPELEHLVVLGDADVVGGDLPHGVTAISTAAATAEDAERVRAYRAAHPIDPNDCLTICWTSGTESAPKGVPRCHYDWLAICWATVDAPRLTEADVLLNPFPMVNMAGINGMFLPWLRVGGVLVQHHPFDLPTFLRQIAEERATYTVAPPALLMMLLHNEALLAAADLSSLRAIGSGSVPLQPSMVRGWQERFGIGIINFFGSNEGIGLMSDPHDIPDPEDRARYFPRYGTPGISWTSRVSEWVQVRLVDAQTDAEISSPGIPGELRIGGPTVFAGYLGGSELPSPFDELGMLRTGDVFEIAGDRNQFLHHVDRAKDMVIRGGVNIAPAELEGLIAAHPAVADVAVVGYPDDVLGEKVAAVVVLRPDTELTLEELVGFLRDKRIASYKLPEHLDVRTALPRNPVGKILKRDLRGELAGNGVRTDG